MSPIISINDSYPKLNIFIENNIEDANECTIKILMTIFIIIHIIMHIDRLIHILFRICLPVAVHPTLNDVLPLSRSELDYPFVAIQLPMMNEIECCQTIIDCACNIEWPRSRIHIQVLDDSTYEEASAIVEKCVEKWICEGVPINILRRPNRKGFKAGTLLYGMPLIRHAEYIALFDADFLPTKDYLLRTIPILMNDSNVGFVQARWTFTNPKESLLTRLQEIILNFHHKCEQEGRSRASLFFTFNGTGGVWRTSTIEQIGGWNIDTLVEDLDITVRAYLNGWYGVYLEDLECLNELPPTLSAYLSQQHRWISGPMQVARKQMKAILKSKNMSVTQKLSCFWYLFRNFVHFTNVISLIIIIPLSLYKQQWNIYNIISIYILVAQSFCVVIFTRNEIHLIFLLAIFLNGMALHNACASIAGFFDYGLAKQWIVTPKFGLQTQDTILIKKEDENILLDSKTNENISIIIKEKNFRKLCCYYSSFGKSLINDFFQKINQRMSQKIRSIRLQKRNFLMGLYLIIMSYVSLQKQLYISAIYIFSSSIMYFILSFGLIGRST